MHCNGNPADEVASAAGRRLTSNAPLEGGTRVCMTGVHMSAVLQLSDIVVEADIWMFGRHCLAGVMTEEVQMI